MQLITPGPFVVGRFNGSIGGVFTCGRPAGVYGRFREPIAQFDPSRN